MALNEKQKRFAHEYIIDLNATHAAIRAGYSERSAHSHGYRLLRHDEVSKLIEVLQKERSERTTVTADRVIEELAKVGFSDIRHVVRWGSTPNNPDIDGLEPNGLGLYPVALIPSDQISDEAAGAVSEVSLTQAGVKVKLHDKLSALEKLGRHLGVFEAGADEAEAVPIKIAFEVEDNAKANVRITTGQAKSAPKDIPE